jgi:hypothetical protein
LNRDGCEAPDKFAALSRWKLQKGPKVKELQTRPRNFAPRTLQKAWKSDQVLSLDFQIDDLLLRWPAVMLPGTHHLGAKSSGDPARREKQRRSGNPTAVESGTMTGTRPPIIVGEPPLQTTKIPLAKQSPWLPKQNRCTSSIYTGLLDNYVF